MQADILNIFIDSVIKTLSTMCNVVPRRNSLELKNSAKNSRGDISGIIGVVGELSGIIAITLPEKLALSLVSSMIGEEIDSLNSTIEDAIGEIINIIAGNAKSNLKAKEFDLYMSLPSVIVGENHSVTSPAAIPSFIIGFETDTFPFWLEVCLKEVTD